MFPFLWGAFVWTVDLTVGILELILEKLDKLLFPEFEKRKRFSLHEENFIKFEDFVCFSY